ncbi:MAG: OmpA family protein [Gemmatimonadaceae bacterium]|nr:OmpA family protein [Gemmatimonadaceae bacterium]
MRFRASVGAIGLALSIAAPAYAQSAGAIEIGVFGRVQFDNNQLLLPATSVAIPRINAAGIQSGTAPAVETGSLFKGFGGRVGYFFADNFSVEGGYHYASVPAATVSKLTLRALLNRPFTEKFGWHVGAGVLLNTTDVKEYTGDPNRENATSGLVSFGGSKTNDFGLAGLIGTRWKFNDSFQLRVDGTASFVPSPKERRTEFEFRLDCNDGTSNLGTAPACVRGGALDGADIDFGVEVGGSFLLNNAKDADGDKVKDKLDTCPNTPKDVVVDAAGCPVDTDGDKVADYLDKCPNTPKGVAVEANGCPVDSDKDGVADYLDKCPSTPSSAKVDNNGCPLDTDKDGVADYLDKCPNTPSSAKVDTNGCPIDTDKDGVADYLDKCPNTASGVSVDANGCATDNDGDGVIDTGDKCPNTPAGVKTDNTGCPLDTDKDGVADYLDKCPNTAAGRAVDDRGCPRLFEAGKTALTLTGVNFANAASRLLPASRPALDRVAEGLVANPDVKVEIGGHTDNRGNARANERLSLARANAVRTYLISKGVKAEQLVAKGYGGSQPIAPNTTAAGRTANRRVEMKQIN